MHFVTNWIENGTDHINIYVTDAKINGINLDFNDEIGIFDGSICVGSSKINDNELILIKVSDYKINNKVIYKFWIDNQKKEISDIIPIYLNNDVNWSNTGTYEPNMTSVVKLYKND